MQISICSSWRPSLMQMTREKHFDALWTRLMPTLWPGLPGRATSTLHFFMETLAEEDIQRWNTQLCNIKAQLQQLLDPARWSLDLPFKAPARDLEGLEQECRDVAVTEWRDHRELPRAFGRHRVLLHMFSGSRRISDLQFYLDRMPLPEHYVLHVVSMDMIVDRVWGDAMAPGTKTYWLRATEAGYVAAFLEGPCVKHRLLLATKSFRQNRKGELRGSRAPHHSSGACPVWRSKNCHKFSRAINCWSSRFWWLATLSPVEALGS